MQQDQRWHAETGSSSSFERSLHSSSMGPFPRPELPRPAWPRSSSPGSSSSSSSSDLEGVPCIVSSSVQEISMRNRSATLRSMVGPQDEKIEFRTQLFGQYSRNPFYTQDRPSPPISPKSEGSVQDSRKGRPYPPEISSSDLTPIAPSPIRPISLALSILNRDARHDSKQPSPVARLVAPTPPLQHAGPGPTSPPSQASSRSSIVPPSLGSPKLRQYEEILAPPQVEDGNWEPHHRKLISNIYALCQSRDWTYMRDVIMNWIRRQPKTTVLLWHCSELDAIKPLAFGYDSLTDEMLPFDEARLKGLGVNSAAIIEAQWRIGILKNLPRDGGHVEFRTSEVVPLVDKDIVGPKVTTAVKQRSKVLYRDGKDKVFYVRKRLEIPPDRPRDKDDILNQIREYHRLNHPNIAKIVASYVQGPAIAFLTPFEEVNLTEYLDAELCGGSHAEQILSSIKDLASALLHIHSHGMHHLSIRPQKILVDPRTGKTFFAVFGVCHPGRKSTAQQLYAPFSDDPSYIYAAPETIAAGLLPIDPTAADAFSLGAVFLEMITFAKNRPVDDLRDARAKGSHDSSFHANLPAVHAYLAELNSVEIRCRSAARRDRVNLLADQCLTVTRRLLAPDPADRPPMRMVDHFFIHGRSRRQPATGPPRLRVGEGGGATAAAESAAGVVFGAPLTSAVFSDLATLEPW